MEERIIIALDFKELKDLKGLIEKLNGQVVYVKVGMELFYSNGREVVEWLKQRQLKIFLDLKLHDIPNTVYGGIRGLLPLGIDMINIHASGGSEMMKAALRAVEEFEGDRPLLIGVTQLTSISQETMNKEQGVVGSISDQVINLATLAKDVGLDGVVCSALEAKVLREKLGEKFCLVTPGVRSSSANSHDQSRVATPGQAFADGAHYIVVGREVTQANDPLAAFENIVKEVTR